MGAAAYIGRVGARKPEVPCTQLVRGDGPRDHNLMWMSVSLLTGEEPETGWRIGWDSEAVVIPVEPRDNITRGREGPRLRSRTCRRLLTR